MFIMPDPTLHPMHRLNVTDHKDSTKKIDIKIVSFIESKILDEANIAEIGQALTSLVESKDRPKLLLDFQNVDHLSSAALGMLINVNQKVKARSGELRLTNIKSQIYEVFVITKLNNLFKILPDRKAALDSFSPS
jgi:anti-sigma B factor antagonist